MDYTKLIDIASKVSLAVVLLALLYLGSTGYWVFGSQYKDMVAQRDEWKALALKGTKVAQQASEHFITGPPEAMPPLAASAKPEDVAARLNKLDEKTKFSSEPTDAPLP